LPHSASALLNRLLARGKFRHLQVLLQLAELGSVQRTADAIGMTQSSVTQTLAYLENLLEVKLFERHARGVRPTAACLVDALPEFSARAPAIQVQLREAEGEDQLLAIARGEVDLVACRRPPVVPEGWEFHPVREDRFAIVCRVDNPLARTRRVVPWSALAEETCGRRAPIPS
jgi:DNA-binding transcriptional LysR family regulator